MEKKFCFCKALVALKKYCIKFSLYLEHANSAAVLEIFNILKYYI